MKPGEYIGTDGRTYTVTSVALRHNEGTPIVTVNLDGSSAILCAPHLRPGHPDFPAAVEALREENERLRAALDLCRRVIGTGEPTSDYEARAERFYRVTHMMAPGKSEPLGFVSRYSYEQRRSAWESWAQQELAEARAALAREEAPHA